MRVGPLVLCMLGAVLLTASPVLHENEIVDTAYLQIDLSQDDTQSPSPPEGEVVVASDETNTTATNETSDEAGPSWKDLVDPLIHTCPEDCNYRGVCNIGFCECRKPFWGKACEKEMCGSLQACTNHGKCINNTITHDPAYVCLCDDGWTGDYCADIDDDCPYECLTQGKCVDGVCVCDKGWSGDYCQTIICPNDCSEHGECVQVGSLGGRCNCTYPWYTEDCSLAHCPDNCHGNGVCDKFTGACLCNDTFTGTACELRLCSNNCTYPRGMCDLTNGTCRCAPNFVGYDCSADLCPGLCHGHGDCLPNGECKCEDRFRGPGCEENLCWHNCSFHGFCLSDGSCLCGADFIGEYCDYDLRCPNNCSGNGHCMNARCNCTGGFSSADCSVAPFRCPEDISCAHGACVSGSCECERGWRGFECSLEVVRVCDATNNCVHGQCDDLGQCVCEFPWTGDYCDRYLPRPIPLVDDSYDVPDPLLLDSPAATAAKLLDFEEHIVSGRCGKYGGYRCNTPIFRHPNPLTPNTIVPRGIRHSPHRAKANETHTANGTFWGDVWGNATEMWEEIDDAREAQGLPPMRPQPPEEKATKYSKAHASHIQQGVKLDPPHPVAEHPIEATTDHDEAHNLKQARRHYYNAVRNRREREATRYRRMHKP